MPALPGDLQSLVTATDTAARERAWAAFLRQHSNVILRLRFEDALSVPEIARLIGVDSPFKVYRQLDKILMTVRRHLEAAGIHGAST